MLKRLSCSHFLAHFTRKKRTHASTQQDDYKIAIRIEGLNMFLNAASGSGQRERMLRFYGVV
jgi:hypothetical protein